MRVLFRDEDGVHVVGTARCEKALGLYFRTFIRAILSCDSRKTSVAISERGLPSSLSSFIQRLSLTLI